MSRLIPKCLKGNKFIDWFTLATLSAAMAENPAIMTASGWKYDKDGKLYQEPDEDSERLSNNLTVLSTFSPTHPVTAVFDVGISSLGRLALAAKIKKAIVIANKLNVPSLAEQYPVDLTELASKLIEEGVPKRVLSEPNLRRLYDYRMYSLGKAAPQVSGRYTGRVGLVRGDININDGVAFLGYENGYPETDNVIGNIALGRNIAGDVTVDGINNITNGAAKGVSETMYNAAIEHSGPIRSGDYLMMPEITTEHVWPKYITEYIDNSGKWRVLQPDGSRKTIYNMPTVRLMKPTYNVPIKYGDVFSSNVINKSGKMIVDFSKGPYFKQGGHLIPKAQLGLKEQRMQANQLHKDLANQNWKEGNILKAGYHWWKGTPGLGGQFENDYIVQSGVAPAIGLKGVPSPEAIKKAEAIATGTKAVGTSANVSKTISNSNSLETGKGVSEVINYFKVKFKTMGLHPRVAKARNNPDFEKWYNKRCLYGYKHPEEQSKIATEVVDKVIKLENGLK